MGLNTMGLAELMIRLGIRYGGEESVKWLDKLYEFIATEAYLASVELARERGPFPAFDESKFLQSGYMKAMPKRVREWWWTAENGKTCLALRYGAKAVELAKGKTAVEVGHSDDVFAALQALKLAVESGELDAQIESASTALRAGFKK